MRASMTWEHGRGDGLYDGQVRTRVQPATRQPRPATMPHASEARTHTGCRGREHYARVALDDGHRERRPALAPHSPPEPGLGDDRRVCGPQPRTSDSRSSGVRLHGDVYGRRHRGRPRGSSRQPRTLSQVRHRGGPSLDVPGFREAHAAGPCPAHLLMGPRIPTPTVTPVPPLRPADQARTEAPRNGIRATFPCPAHRRRPQPTSRAHPTPPPAQPGPPRIGRMPAAPRPNRG